MEHGPGMKMYFLLKMGISQPAMWVYQRVSIIFCQKIIWLWYSKSQFSHLIWQIWSDWAVGVLTWISRGTMWCGWSVPICDTTSLLERNHKDFFFFFGGISTYHRIYYLYSPQSKQAFGSVNMGVSWNGGTLNLHPKCWSFLFCWYLIETHYYQSSISSLAVFLPCLRNQQYVNIQHQLKTKSWIQLIGGDSCQLVDSNIFGIFTPNLGDDAPNLTVAYFSNGLVQPPTSLCIFSFFPYLFLPCFMGI